MFDSETLEVGIGMVFLFLMMSLICTGIREFIEGILKWRAMNLERAIRTLLDDSDGRLTALFYSHPLISSLYRGGYDPSTLGGSSGAGGRLFLDAPATGDPVAAPANDRATPAGRARNMPWSARRNLPSYIPSEQFAKALIDLVARGPAGTVGGIGTVGPSGANAARPLSVALLQERAASLASPFLRRAVQSAIDHSAGDVERLKLNLQQWFDGSMDRAAGWYKRRTQMVLFGLGLGAAVLLNVDALYVMSRLTTDKILRDAVVAAAANAKEPAAAGEAAAGGLQAARRARDELNAIGMPMGWVDTGNAQQIRLRPIQSCRFGIPADCGEQFSAYRAFQMVIGWLVTAIGVTLGAPFWFDVLNRFMVIRATVKPHEKSPEEGSEDRKGARPPAPPAPPSAA